MFSFIASIFLACSAQTDPDKSSSPCSWQDADGDGFGDSAIFQTVCIEEEGWVANDSDCDDSAAEINPDAVEQCDGVDQNCDGVIDDHRVPSDYENIQLAVDSIPDGSTICIEPGSYTEKVNVTGRVLQFKSQQGKENTIFDLSEGSPIFLADDRGILTEEPSETSSQLSISGFSITGTHPELGEDEYLYGGLIYSTNGDVSLSDIDMSDVSAFLGLGGRIFGTLVYAWGGSLNMTNISVSDVYLGGDAKDIYSMIIGGVVYTESVFGTVSHSSFTDINIEIFSDNEDAACHVSSGVVLFPSGDEAHISKDILFDNNSIDINCPSTTSSSADGAIAELKNNAYIEDLRITNNHLGFFGWASSSKGFLKGSGINLNINNLEVSHNYHRMQGRNANSNGIVYFYMSDVQGNDWRINDNEIDATKNPTNDFSNTAIGGGLKLWNTSGTLSQIEVRGNRLLSSEYTKGAGIDIFLEQDKTVRLSRFVVAGNRMEGINYVLGGGFSVSMSAGEVFLQNGDIYGNQGGVTAQDSFGAGMSITGSLSSTGYVSVQNVNIVANTAQIQSNDGVNTAVTINDDINVLWEYNNVFGNMVSSETRFGAQTQIGLGSLMQDPLYMDIYSEDPMDWDFALSPLSPCIDAGVPSILDLDGSISDIGSYGGP